LADPDGPLKKSLERWITVRVTDMRGVDLNVYRFNFDLTLAVLLMHADGTIYATYAGRDDTDASSHQSTSSLARVLDLAYERHAKHRATPRAGRKPMFVEQLPWWRDNEKAQENKCFHCHQVHDAWQNEARRAGRWTERDQYTWPDPVQLGLRLDREDQVLVTQAKAPFERGDRILAIGAARPLAFGDVQRALDEAPWGESELAVTVRRGDREVPLAVPLAEGWKRPTPRVYAWRSMKWPMSPKPGFGGPLLNAEQKKKLGLPVDGWAFRVQYIVTWGPQADTGRNAHQAGIRKGMIVTAVDGESDFVSMAHFQAWFRMTRRVGKPVEFRVLQNGTPRTLSLTPLP